MMILDGDEKTQYNVTSRIQFKVQDEKHVSRYNTSDQPPSYEALFATSSTPSLINSFATTPTPSSFNSSSIATQSTTTTQPPNTHFLPCVIPQISSPFGNTYASPFIRAYPPSLATLSIPQPLFLSFLDGLNQVFISHPLLRSVSAAGSIMQMLHGTPVVQFVGMGLQVSSDLGSAATSYTRTKIYLQVCNAEMFHPRGLHVEILGKGEMMVRVGCEGERLRLLPLETGDDLDRSMVSTKNGSMGGKEEQRVMKPMDDPRVRRLNALKGYVAPLNFDVPAVVPPDNLLAKMSAWQAQKAATKNDEKEAKRRAKAQAKQGGGGELRGKDERKLDRKLAKLEKSLEKDGGKHKEKDVRKAQREYEREERKIERKLERRAGKPEKGKDKDKDKFDDREEKQANKVRWVVITQWEGDEEEEDDDDSSDHDFPSAETSR